MTAERQRLIAEALGRKPETILEIDVGYDFAVAIVDDDWVFRFPRRSGVEEALELETLLLPALAPPLPVLVPSFDLGPEHLLVRDGRLVGVIDWGDTRIGDPALDHAWLLNGPFADWEVDPDLRRRARFYHRLAPWYEAHYGLFTNQPAHVERGMDGIRERL